MFRAEKAGPELPTTEVWPFDSWPEVPPGGFEMEFRLVYDGKLPAASQSDSRVPQKHEIRRVFSKQLAELWKTHPRLRAVAQKGESTGGTTVHVMGELQVRGQPLVYYRRCGRRFLPLINNDSGVGCSLDILFLRRDQPGALIHSGGDIDNRIKVLFDALRLPSNDAEVVGDPAEDDDPFYCLLEDDRLITEIKVTTDRLLTPLNDSEHINDVRLIIHVKSIVVDSRNLGAVGF